jgi:hypothetical protein
MGTSPISTHDEKSCKIPESDENEARTGLFGLEECTLVPRGICRQRRPEQELATPVQFAPTPALGDADTFGEIVRGTRAKDGVEDSGQLFALDRLYF